MEGENMTILVRSIGVAVSIAASLTLFSGCAINMKVPIKDPVPSSSAYRKPAAAPAPVALAFKDERADADKAKMVTGRIPMNLVSGDKPFDAVPWVATHTVQEMVARGLPVRLAADASATGVLVKTLRVENHRANGFSPFVTFTSARADMMTASGPVRLTSYIKRGKVPVMSFDEVIEPTYSDPLGLVTKELAAKLNQVLFRQSFSDEVVDALIAKINKEASSSNASYLDVYQLGFSNNPRAVPDLVKLCRHANEYVRLAAISSLGILKANGQFDFLVGLHESTEPIWQDRAMALKAIGDLGDARSRAYLEQQQKKLESLTDKESGWLRELIKLYL